MFLKLIISRSQKEKIPPFLYIFIFCSKKKQVVSFQTGSFSGTVFSDLILSRNCLQRPYPLQEVPFFKPYPLQELSLETISFAETLSLQTLSFTGTVVAHRILYRNYLYRSNSSHTGTVFSHFSHLKNLFLGTITFPGKHLCNYLFPNNITQAI